MTHDLRLNGRGGLAWHKWSDAQIERAARLRLVGHSRGVIANEIGGRAEDVQAFLETHPLGRRVEVEMRGRFG